MDKARILVLCDDLWHPAEVIERGLEHLMQDRYDFDVVKDAKDILTPELLDAYPAVLCCKSDCICQGNQAPWFDAGVTEVMPEDFERYIRAGHGFLAVHSGLAYRRGHQESLGDVTGSYFLGHPPRCNVELRVTKAEHPIAKGIENFTVRDEHYMMDLAADDACVFLESQSEKGGVQPAGYTRVLGNGRLCALTPGHILSVWTHPQFQRLLLNALRWCLKENE